MTRYAKVYGRGLTQEIVQAYLPSNYEVRGTHEDGAIVICGVDNLGWTLDDYVIPRLASGNYTAHEATQDDLDEVSVGLCYRCHEIIEEFSLTGGEPNMWKDSQGSVACAEWHGHDENGWYAPMHSPVDDKDQTVIRDSDDSCLQQHIAKEA